MRVFIVISLLLAGCGGGGGGGSTSTPPPSNAGTMVVHYLRATASYDGWGLHLWGDALATATITTWTSPRPYDAVQSGAAVFNVPVADKTRSFSFILHNGDLKSPLPDLTLVPVTFGMNVWIAQDDGTVYATEADARTAIARLGSASAAIDLSTVTHVSNDSGLAADWADHANFIEIYVRGFQDSNGDGNGDLQGVISRLDWLRDQGYTAIWLMPVFKSADHDHGYAVVDYRGIEPDYGTLADLDQLLAQAHARGIAVILDYVMNHAASTNPVFLDATTKTANSKRDWFVWSATHPAGWNTFSGDPWRNDGNGWYYGVFGQLMPDWNLRNPAVVAYHLDNLRWWLNRGVDGFRFDATEVLFENGAGTWLDSPDNHPLLAQAQAVINGYGKRFLVCEAPDSPAAYAVSASCGHAFAFQAIAPLYASVAAGRVDAGLATFLADPLADSMPMIAGNHDSFAGNRVWSRLGGDQAAYQLIAASYLLAARTPFAYYGEDIGMADGAGLTGDAALRTPMSWTNDAVNAGFSTGTPFRALSGNSVTQNVATGQASPGTLLQYYRSLLTLRKTYPLLGAGALSLQSTAGDVVFRFTRENANECLVVLVNYASIAQTSAVNTSCTSASFSEVFGGAATMAANASGALTVSVPARAATVWRATH